MKSVFTSFLLLFVSGVVAFCIVNDQVRQKLTQRILTAFARKSETNELGSPGQPKLIADELQTAEEDLLAALRKVKAVLHEAEKTGNELESAQKRVFELEAAAARQTAQLSLAGQKFSTLGDDILAELAAKENATPNGPGATVARESSRETTQDVRPVEQHPKWEAVGVVARRSRCRTYFERVELNVQTGELRGVETKQRVASATIIFDSDVARSKFERTRR